MFTVEGEKPIVRERGCCLNYKHSFLIEKSSAVMFSPAVLTLQITRTSQARRLVLNWGGSLIIKPGTIIIHNTT